MSLGGICKEVLPPPSQEQECEQGGRTEGQAGQGAQMQGAKHGEGSLEGRKFITRMKGIWGQIWAKSKGSLRMMRKPRKHKEL